MPVERFGSGGAYEPIVGYSRVVRAGAHVWVSGCTASGPSGAVLGETAGEQMRAALETLVAALATAGARPEDVVRTRIYLTDIDRWEEAGRVHGEVFGEIRPATTMVEVSKLIDPRMLVEIEADAYVSARGS